VFSRVFRASCCDHFSDDYMYISPASCSILPSDSNQQHVNSSQWFLDELHTLVGMHLEPKKRKHSSSVNVALGVDANLSEAASLKKVSLKPTSRRTDFIFDSLRQLRSTTTSPLAWQRLSWANCSFFLPQDCILGAVE